MNAIVTEALLNAREILKQHGYTLFRCSFLKDADHPSLEIIIDGQVTDVIAEPFK